MFFEEWLDENFVNLSSIYSVFLRTFSIPTKQSDDRLFYNFCKFMYEVSNP